MRYLRYGLDPYCEPTGERETYEGVEFVEIGPGIFRMGSTCRAEGGDWLGKLCAALGLPWGKRPKPSHEMPVHWVELRGGFWIATTEVTYEQYERFRPEHRQWKWERTNRHPAVFVSWADARDFCSWLGGRSGRAVRLPSEAEWECACRAGSRKEYSFGNSPGELGRYEWFRDNSGNKTQPVATKLPNPWGLYDLQGNVCEWCEDTFFDHHQGAPTDGSARLDGDKSIRVFRGGCCWFRDDECRSAARPWFPPHRFYGVVGFRPVFSHPGD